MSPGAGINIIVGDNASGKSSVLESIFFLGRARSFRRTLSDALIRDGADEFTVFARTEDRFSAPGTLGIRRRRRETLWKIDGRADASLLDLVRRLPIQFIDPNLHQLLEEGPTHRRRFLDWGVFHVEHDFFPAWQRMQRALRQRNRALKRRATAATIRAWDHELVAQVGRVDNARRRYLADWQTNLRHFMAEVMPEVSLDVRYHPGWAADRSYFDVLAAGFDRDRELGHTQSGPHRADLKVRLEGALARERASRGQQKLITMVMLLAQAALLKQRHGYTPIILVDDLAAELAADYRSAVFRLLAAQDAQCFLTFLDIADVPDRTACSAMFHVEHGQLSRMI